MRGRKSVCCRRDMASPFAFARQRRQLEKTSEGSGEGGRTTSQYPGLVRLQRGEELVSVCCYCGFSSARREGRMYTV